MVLALNKRLDETMINGRQTALTIDGQVDRVERRAET